MALKPDKMNFSINESIVSAEIEEAMGITHSMELTDLNLNQLIANPLNTYTEDDIQDLAYAIREQGLLQPLLAVAEGRSTFRLIGGHRRLRALIYNRDNFGGPSTAACYVLDDISEEEEEAAIVFANSQRVKTQADITMEVAALRRLHEAKKKRGEDAGHLDRYIASVMKMSEASVNRHLSIAKNLTPEAREIYEANEMSYEAAYTLSSIPAKEQKKIVVSIEGKNETFSKPQIKAEQKALTKEKKKRDVVVAFKASELADIIDTDGKTARQLKEELLALWKGSMS